MNDFIENQTNWLIIIILGMVISVASLDYISNTGNTINSALSTSVSCVMLFILLMTYRMRCVVTVDRIIIVYGIGLIRKTIYLDEIATVDLCRLGWQGRGIRVNPWGTT